nr:hypothetical protein [Tanacetum cinerariifolium]
MPRFDFPIHASLGHDQGPSDTPLCYLCTCEHCGNILIDGACLKCNSGAENSFTYDPIPKAFNEVQSISNPPPQSHYNIYLCQICESNSHYGYESSQRISLVYEPEPCYNQNFGDNTHPHDSPGVTPLIDHHCCYKCGDSLDDFFCYQCTCEFCGNGAHEAIAITFDLPTVESKDSLRMRDEHLDTLLETKSDEFIKSSVENLVLIPSESEDLFDSEYDVHACDDFTAFSNILFDADDDFSSSDNESFFDEYFSKEIYSNPLFDEEIISIKIDPHHFNSESDLIESLLNHDSSIISSSLKIDSLLDEFAGELTLLKSSPPGIDETDCDPEEEIRLIKKLMYDNSSPRPPKEINPENSDAAIESFSLSPIPVKDSDSFMEEIDLSFTPDDSMPPGIEEDNYDSERDILILEELLSNDSLLLPENESFYFDIPSSSGPPAKSLDDASRILTVKVVGDISEHDVPMPRFLPTQPTLASNQEKSPHLLSHRVNPSLNIQNEPSDHEIFINALIQQKLQNEYAQPFSAIAITFDLPTVEPEDSLRMRDEHLDTLLETESDEFIKSSVENLVLIPSESEDLSDSEYDVHACDDFTAFSNILFDADDDFSSSDNESFFNEDFSKEIYSNPLFDEEIISIKIDPHHFNSESDLIESLLNHDSSIISSSLKIDSLLDEFAGELTLLKSSPPGIDETDCDPEEEIRLIKKLMYDNSSPRPPEEINPENSDAAIESFSPSPIPVKDSDSFMEEIDLSFTPDDSMPPGIEEDDYDSERDILILEELLSNDSLLLPENESFYFDIPSSSGPPAKSPDDDSRILTVKVVGDISEHDVPMPRFLPTQPTLASNQEKSPHLLSHRGLKASQLHSEIPMMIYGGNTPILDVLFLHFYPH